jgi:diadenosine tetraphosphate (Ap4A) HIT family hydrolase
MRQMEIPGRIATPNGTLTLPAFGQIERPRLLAVDDLFAVVSDKFPISPGHTLIIARRPAARFQELTSAEKARLLVWIGWTQQHLASQLNPKPDAFNIGLNDGPAAGQTMPQLHFHVIPRYTGDVPDPRGGIRHFIPSKARYWEQLQPPPMQPTKTPPVPTLDWSSVIGHFMINFGTLDLLAQDFLQSILPPDEFSRLRDRHFHDRIQRIKQHVTEADYPPEKQQAMAQFLVRLEPARELRNHIAHGLLRIGMAEDQKTLVLTLSLPRDLDGPGSPQALHLTHQELLTALTALTALIEDFKRLFGNWVVDADIRF